jgi:NADPH-dependent 2,4-dienoyl-CoA reductase/sulfur reductase-like enzyme
MAQMINKDVVVVGGGSAGMAAAVGARRGGAKSVLIIERMPFLGGVLNQCIHNGFGVTEFHEDLTGPEFISRFKKEMDKEGGIECAMESTVLSLSKDLIVTYENRQGIHEVQAKAIVMATGCYERGPGAISLPGDRPSGIMTAGQAQLYINEYGYLPCKRAFILGSGDIGLIMARRLTLEGAKVLGVAELMPWSNGLKRNIAQCLEDFGIPLYLSHTVTKAVGRGRLERIEISQVDDKLHPIPGTEQSFDVDTLILAVGLIPYNELLVNLGAKIGASKGALVDENLETSIDGIFSCGNVLHVHDLVDNVVAEGRAAGASAAEYAKGGLRRSGAPIEVKAGEGVGYVVPGAIFPDDAGDEIVVKFRVRRPAEKVYIDYSQGGEILKSFYKPSIIPSEMEIQKLPKNLLKNNHDPIVVSVRRKEA